MQTAVPAGTAVFRGKRKRTDSRFAAFGGRGELRSPLSPHRNAPSGHSGVPHGLFSDSAPTHLRCAGVPLGLFGKPKRSSFSRVRGLHQAILWLDLQNAHAPGSLRSPSDAAPECFFKNIPVFRSAYSASRNARPPAASRPSVGGGSFAPPCTPLSRRPPDTGRTASKAPLEGSWRAAPEGWVRHGDAQFCGIEERRFRLRLTGLHAFCRRQRLWNQSVWPSRTCRAKALMSEKAGQSRPAPPASPSSCTSEPAVMSR